MPLIDRVVRWLARYSEGLHLTVDNGPLSGPVTEYVVEDTPRGTGWLGRRIDRAFLNLDQNVGTRERIRTTKELVAEVLMRRRSARIPTVIFDVASGTARYLRDLARELDGSDDVTIVCHDRSPRQIMWGRARVDAEHLRRFTFAVGDATDAASYLTRHDPDVILAVQLFPYLHDDSEVKAVIKLAYDHIRSEGCLICTTTVSAGSGSPFWNADALGRRPACRAPETIKGWLREAGFTRIDQRYSEPHGFALIGWKTDQDESETRLPRP